MDIEYQSEFMLLRIRSNFLFTAFATMNASKTFCLQGMMRPNYTLCEFCCCNKHFNHELLKCYINSHYLKSKLVKRYRRALNYQNRTCLLVKDSRNPIFPKTHCRGVS